MATKKTKATTAAAKKASPTGPNGDIDLVINIGGKPIFGIGCFHKTLPHNNFGEVEAPAFKKLVKAASGTSGAAFAKVPAPLKQNGDLDAAPLVNPQAGLALDRLTPPPSKFTMPPAPGVLSTSTAAEMVELYWMALLRDKTFEDFENDADVGVAVSEVKEWFAKARAAGERGGLEAGIDLPGSIKSATPISTGNIFRCGLPDEEFGPLVSQFFLRNASFGTQTIDQMQLPYKAERNYLTDFNSWWTAQNHGWGADGKAYAMANESKAEYFETRKRHITTMRDLARFVHKDALHQAYFNAALLMLSGGAKWTSGNPYRDDKKVIREQGFGTLGGPHILALVSEVATRALKVVWNQKWQTHLRLRPEAYGGLVHVQTIGAGTATKPLGKRQYGITQDLATTQAAKRIMAASVCEDHPDGTLLLPMAFTSGSPMHPAYGAGHATVAGACVTVLKAYFETEVPITSLEEKTAPYAEAKAFQTYVPGKEGLVKKTFPKMTIEGELNKLASNVAMGRSMGGVHWRTDNTRSLRLGEAIAAHILADITKDVEEKVTFKFRTFARNSASGTPRNVEIRAGKVSVDGKTVKPGSML